MWSTALKIVLAWIPFYALWALFVLGYADATVGGALSGSAITIGSAALLGMGVWALTGRFPWPDRIRLGFYVLHAGLAALYSVGWYLAGSAIGALINGVPMELRFWDWEDSGWRFLMGVWLYGLVAGICYALRIRGRLREQERAAARLEGLATQARLQSLQARLNPHFLFNALNSVSALIPESPAAAEEAVERLADLLRYSLAEKDGTVTLEQEWMFTRDYLEMEGLRLGDRLKADTAIPDEALHLRIPPFALQTLVENAVRHGVCPSEDGATITIRARQEEGELVMTVEDDGVGVDPTDLDTTSGSGIRNLRERLVGTWGTRAALTLRTHVGEGFRAELRVPTTEGRL